MSYAFSNDENHNTYMPLVAFYVTARLKSGFEYLGLWFAIPMIRGFVVGMCTCIVIPSMCWIASIYVDMPYRLALVFPALVFDLYGSYVVFSLFHYGQNSENKPGAGFLRRHFDFCPAMNIEHMVERTNAFVSLVFGYSVFGVMFQNNDGPVVSAFLGKGVLGLVQAFMFNWIYFDIDGANLQVHAIRRSTSTGTIWLPIWPNDASC